jgi:hypothetical protein
MKESLKKAATVGLLAVFDIGLLVFVLLLFHAVGWI